MKLLIGDNKVITAYTVVIDGVIHSKVTVKVIDGAIYVIKDTLKNAKLVLLTDGFILSESLIENISDEYISLLRLIKENYNAIKIAIKFCENTGKTITNINGISQLTVRNY